MEAVECYKRAGRIHAEVREDALRRIRPGMKLIEIADFIEHRIQEKGGGLAFPVNTSLNEIAAHYVARGGDETIVKEGDTLKVDMGVEIDGYIADGAFTYCSEGSELATTAEKAIEEAVRVITPGVRVGDVSEAIEATVQEAGFGLIVNLTGHGLGRNMFHAPPTIPNTATGSAVILEEGQVIALEPFVVEAGGQVRESAPVEIYRFLQERPVRMPEARQLLQKIQECFRGFPFARRWLFSDFSPVKVSMALRQLEAAGAVESYPPLKEREGQPVAQAEHTIIVADPPIVTTRV